MATKIGRSNGECIEFVGARQKHGYGAVRDFRTGKTTTAHRLVAEIKLARPLLRGESVCHSCDNPPCVNPDHLVVADQRKNAQDMFARARNRGQGQKLTPDLVREIRSLHWRKNHQKSNTRELAERYGVAPATITRIINGKNWGWIQ